MAKASVWLSAFRLRTLPLALSGILLGSMLAYADGYFDGLILLFSILTATFLQILSNLANDLGDTENGADNTSRVGPQRAVQSGIISKAQMKKADKSGATLTVIIAEQELDEQTISIKNMQTGEQQTVADNWLTHTENF